MSSPRIDAPIETEAEMAKPRLLKYRESVNATLLITPVHDYWPVRRP